MPMVCLQLKHSPSPYNQRWFLSVDHQEVSPVMQQQNYFFIWRLDQSLYQRYVNVKYFLNKWQIWKLVSITFINYLFYLCI